ncbi:hypothetical protein AAHA92_06801 [Salvia divinorum]|uniref:Uncharacterized protein n=1 Tax=Salvia divinorum TaxID=28513 RepID=A0ABD1IAW5_SALDI
MVEYVRRLDQLALTSFFTPAAVKRRGLARSANLLDGSLKFRFCVNGLERIWRHGDILKKLECLIGASTVMVSSGVLSINPSVYEALVDRPRDLREVNCFIL